MQSADAVNLLACVFAGFGRRIGRNGQSLEQPPMPANQVGNVGQDFGDVRLVPVFVVADEPLVMGQFGNCFAASDKTRRGISCKTGQDGQTPRRWSARP